MQHVIVLGAGASKADGAPLQFDLFSDYFKAEKSNLGAAHNVELREFFRVFYGIDVASVDKQTEFPSFEDALGTLELAISRNEEFRICREAGDPDLWDQHRIERCREHVVSLICTVLAKKLGVRGTGGQWHNRLVQNLPRTGNVSFISFNYDLLIDNAIGNQGRRFDYGTIFANPFPKAEEPVGLYKLHGSLNWLRCPICGGLTQTGDVKGGAYPLDERPKCALAICGANTHHFVIPPTFFKVMSDFHLQQIWHQAERRLRAADCIYFCGYSLPDADMHVRYLLKRAEVNRTTAPQVFVVSNHAGKKDDDRRRERQRYLRQFRDASKVVFTKWSFEDFASDPLGMATKPRAEVEWMPAAPKAAEAAG